MTVFAKQPFKSVHSIPSANDDVKVIVGSEVVCDGVVAVVRDTAVSGGVELDISVTKVPVGVVVQSVVDAVKVKRGVVVIGRNWVVAVDSVRPVSDFVVAVVGHESLVSPGNASVWGVSVVR